MGIPKAITGGELSVAGTEVPETRTYDILPADAGRLKVSISTGGGYWTFTFVKETGRSESQIASPDNNGLVVNNVFQ